MCPPCYLSWSLPLQCPSNILMHCPLPHFHRWQSTQAGQPFFFRLLPHTRILSWSFSLKTGRCILKLFQQKPGGKRRVGVGCGIWRMLCACCFFLERDLKSPSASVCWAERASSPSNNFLNPVSSKIRCTNLGWKCSHVCWATMQPDSNYIPEILVRGSQGAWHVADLTWFIKIWICKAREKTRSQNSPGDLEGNEAAQAIGRHSVQRTAVLFPISYTPIRWMAFHPRNPTSASRELRMYKDCPQRWGSFPSGIRSTVWGFLYSSSTWQRKWTVQGQQHLILGEHTEDL